MTQNKSTAISLIARLGLITKGLVYFMVGLLAFQASIGMGGQPANTQQALEEFISQPFGSVLLIGCVVGLFAYALWRFLQSFIDPGNRGHSTKVLLLRIVDFFVAILYLSFSYASWQIFRGLNTSSSSQKSEVWVGKILELPYGKWLVLFCALIIAIVGCYQFYSAYKAQFDYHFDTQNMNKSERSTLRKLGQIGITAWGVVYCMIAILFYQAAVTYNPQQAGGVDKALNALRDQPFGIWILRVTAAGMLIYGIYLFILSYYRKIYSR